MYQKLPNLVIGFHGCKESVSNKVLKKGQPLVKSMNSYDWLGNGIYFWEQNYQRALEWAKDRYNDEAAVIGAVIDLGYCLNLTDYSSADILRMGYNILKVRCETVGVDLPENRASSKDGDLLLRDLDCAVIQQIHDFNKQTGNLMYDSVRGIFVEGAAPYEGSGFREKTHVQICICNPNCIKGYFEPLQKNEKYTMP